MSLIATPEQAQLAEGRLARGLMLAQEHEIARLRAENAELLAWARVVRRQAGAMADHAVRLAEGPARQALALYDTATVHAPRAVRDLTP